MCTAPKSKYKDQNSFSFFFIFSDFITKLCFEQRARARVGAPSLVNFPDWNYQTFSNFCWNFDEVRLKKICDRVSSIGMKRHFSSRSRRAAAGIRSKLLAKRLHSGVQWPGKKKNWTTSRKTPGRLREDSGKTPGRLPILHRKFRQIWRTCWQNLAKFRQYLANFSKQ